MVLCGGSIAHFILQFDKTAERGNKHLLARLITNLVLHENIQRTCAYQKTNQKYKLLDYAQLCKITNVQLLIKPHACRSCTVSYKSVSPRHTPSIIPTARTPGPYYITVSAHFHFHVIHLLYQTQKVDL